jgi:hypothetical protein
MMKVMAVFAFMMDVCILKLRIMSFTVPPSHLMPVYEQARKERTLFSRFFAWAAAEDAPRHIGWVGITVMSMTAVFFPLSLSAILFNGASFGLIIATIVSLVLVVVTNLAALPTKYTIPFFVLGVLIDVVAVVLSFLVR